MAEIRWLSETGLAESALTGGKGASLGDLLQLGLPVPNGFVVTTQAYLAECERAGLIEALWPLLVRHRWAAVERAASDIILSHGMTAALRESLIDAYRRLGSPAVAVRSSATAEDLESASFAGQYDSFLNVRGEGELLQAICKCWASLWSERALRYRHRRSIEHLSAGMAVVVQEMVPAAAAGVVFTVDPITNGSDRMYVEAARGLGEAVVTGVAKTEVWRVDRATLLPDEPGKAGGIIETQKLGELCRLALEIEKHKGLPQDIEFAIADERLYILQARAITAVDEVSPEPLPPLGEPSLVDKLMRPIAAERYAIAPRPLDNIVFIRVVGAVMYAIRKLGGAISVEDEAEFRAQIWRQAYRLPAVRLTPRFLLAQWKYLQLLKGDWLAWWANGPRVELKAVCAATELADLSDEKLFERADRILATWERALNERFYVSSAINARQWLDRIVGLVVSHKQRPQVLADLMSGLHTPTSEVNDALWQLSRRARQDPAIYAAIRNLRLDDIAATAAGESFRIAFCNFLEKYGHREGAGYYLSTPTWSRNPIQVVRLVSSLAEVESRPETSANVLQRYNAARTLVDRRLRFVPGARKLFGLLLYRFRALDTFRETSHFDITRPLAVLQRIVAELEQRLQSRGVLQKCGDLFYLTYDEVRSYCLGTPPPPGEVRKLVARRRATYELANSKWQCDRSAAPSGNGELRGVAASRGIARGRARVIRDETDFALLQPGEVLVCPYSNPAWTPLFISAAAVVSETGGAASHAAIVAREYGIPAVMSVPGAAEALKDGPEVVVDGERGIVLRTGAGTTSAWIAREDSAQEVSTARN